MRLCDEELLTCPRRFRSYKVFDGNGLYAEIPPTGNIRWRVKYMFGGKDKRLSLGLYPGVTIELARERCESIRAQVREGVDPSLARRMLSVSVTQGMAPPMDDWRQIIESVREDMRNMLREVRHARFVTSI